eukprot:3938579-Rhodomonas_salina.4
MQDFPRVSRKASRIMSSPSLNSEQGEDDREAEKEEYQGTGDLVEKAAGCDGLAAAAHTESAGPGPAPAHAEWQH